MGGHGNTMRYDGNLTVKANEGLSSENNINFMSRKLIHATLPTLAIELCLIIEATSSETFEALFSSQLNCNS